MEIPPQISHIHMPAIMLFLKRFHSTFSSGNSTEKLTEAFPLNSGPHRLITHPTILTSFHEIVPGKLLFPNRFPLPSPFDAIEVYGDIIALPIVTAPPELIVSLIECVIDPLSYIAGYFSPFRPRNFFHEFPCSSVPQFFSHTLPSTDCPF